MASERTSSLVVSSIEGREDLNPIERAERGERVVTSPPESMTPHPVYGFDAPPAPEPTKE